MKKILSLVLTLCLILAACACAVAEEDLGDTLVLYSSMTEADLEALITCFNEVYPDINIEVISGSAGEFTAKIQAEAGNPQGDVTWGGLADSDGQKYAAIFEPWVSEHDDEQMEGYSTPNGFYSMDHLSTVCFCVNTELEKELGLDIRSYEDLLNPALKGKIVISDPNSSSAAWNNLCNIFSVYGVDTQEAWDYIDALLENTVVVEKSSVCFNSVSDGEYVVGLTYEDGAIKLNQSAAELGIEAVTEVRYPSNGTSASAFGVAVIKGAPHMAAAKAFVNWVTSAEGQSAMAEYMGGTLRFTNANYTSPENAWLTASSEITWVVRDVPTLTAQKADLLAKWNEHLAAVQH
jgi:iron(III) transport system substrate-binding protein